MARHASANALAAALEIMAPVKLGHVWTAVCVHCLIAIDPYDRYPARRAVAGGDCMRCSYTGYDVFVTRIPMPGTADALAALEPRP